MSLYRAELESELDVFLADTPVLDVELDDVELQAVIK